MNLDWNKAGQFASLGHAVHLVMQHMHKTDGCHPWLEIHPDGSGAIKTYEHREPEIQLSFTRLDDKGYDNPFEVIKRYFAEQGSNFQGELEKFINEKLEVADDRAYDLEYQSESSYYFGRRNALKDVLAFIHSQGTLVE